MRATTVFQFELILRGLSKFIVVGWRENKPIYDIQRVAALGYKTNMTLDLVLKEIKEGRAYGVNVNAEMSAERVQAAMDRIAAEGVRRSAKLKG